MARIGTRGSGAASAVQGAASAGGASAGAVAGQAMAGLAGKMAASIGGALGLTGSATGQWQGNGNDPYEIEELVEALASEIGGTAADAGELSRALHGFVQESASLFAARPESRSLAFLNTVISEAFGSDTAATLAAVSQQVDAATIRLRTPVR